MPKLSNVEPLTEVKNAYVARTASLRCTAIELTDGSLCLYNPVAGLEGDALKSLNALGKVSHIFAPNYYHNKAAGEYLDAFPKAKLCASKAAQPRLEKVTELKFKDLTSLKSKLPTHLSLIEPEGLKNGEVWIRASAITGLTWFVVDAFGGEKMTAKNERTNKVSYLKTFPNYGVGDKSIYLAWLTKQLKTDKPTTVAPCHGAIMSSKTLSKDATATMTDLLG